MDCFGVQSVDSVSRCTTSYLLAKSACLWWLVLLCCIVFLLFHSLKVLVLAQLFIFLLGSLHLLFSSSHCWFCFLLGSSMLFIFFVLLLSSHILVQFFTCCLIPWVATQPLVFLVGFLALLFDSSYVVGLFGFVI